VATRFMALKLYARHAPSVNQNAIMNGRCGVID